MNFKTLLKLRAANNCLPHDSYFTYKNEEIYEFVTQPIAGLELSKNRFIFVKDISVSDIKFTFEK